MKKVNYKGWIKSQRSEKKGKKKRTLMYKTDVKKMESNIEKNFKKKDRMIDGKNLETRGKNEQNTNVKKMEKKKEKII